MYRKPEHKPSDYDNDIVTFKKIQCGIGKTEFLFVWTLLFQTQCLIKTESKAIISSAKINR